MEEKNKRAQIVGIIGMLLGATIFLIAVGYKSFFSQGFLPLIFPLSLSISVFFIGYALSKGSIKVGLIWGIVFLVVIFIIASF